MSDKNVIKLSVLNLFKTDKYIVPIYQRNYAWKAMEIEQLIEDINDYNSFSNEKERNYFLGSLVVNEIEDQRFEVIDGQQRLTTLFLLQKYLEISLPQNALRFEARVTSNQILETINKLKLEEFSATDIGKGFKIIDRYLNRTSFDVNQFKTKLENVFLVRVQVPKGINLNHYFEVMNTRGEQLELHEIAKARLMSMLSSEQDKATANLIWQACSNMQTYLQMNFSPEIRNKIFHKNWDEFNAKITTFDALSDRLVHHDISALTAKKSLLDVLTENKQQSNEKKDKPKEEENERFESILSFPNFLLQVHVVLYQFDEEAELEGNLDDKKLLKILAVHWKTIEDAKMFLFAMFKVRRLFDKYIIKREFARDYKEDGHWSLQKLLKYQHKTSDSPKYVATFSDKEETDTSNNKQLRTLQSCLRVTYTSPKTMHWITRVLSTLYRDEKSDLIELLENYSQEKINNINFDQVSGFAFERIVFTYLDYLLYRDGYRYKNKEIIKKQLENWEFQFRNSIEHFFPQHPNTLAPWQEEDLHGFGNLALITVSANAKFSNLPPEGKIASFKELIKQSLKLQIMAEMIKHGEWTPELAKTHAKEMLIILKQ